jgi:hypothetical protein
MTQEQNDLLLKDLCVRLPYGVEVEYNSIKCEVLSIDKYNEELTIWICTGYSTVVKLEDVKTYLFPLSSITEEQKVEYCGLQEKVIYNSKGPINSDVMEYVNWCYKNHIDINNLIPMGLANDATGLNIY